MADCSLLQKALLMPGCRPWDPATEQNTLQEPFRLGIPYITTPSPMRPIEDTSGEFAIVKAIKSTVSNTMTNASRIASKAKKSIGDATSSFVPDVGNMFDGIQSTLIKVIILVIVVAVVALFGMSYVQSKGASYAK